ncbi:MAG TPA: hypothetical protein PKV41_03305 [Candidatus Omnitrophota bacterium]|nr:hypothetical protein [Candidatus Omnitrophota bacterium]
MSGQYDFKKEWEKTRDQLAKFSREAAKVAKKGEKELVKFSRRSKLHIDATAISLKKEHLYYLIGKEYTKEGMPAEPTPKLSKLINDLKKADRDQQALDRKLKQKEK